MNKYREIINKKAEIEDLPWCSAECELLARMVYEKKPWDEIATRLERSKHKVVSKWNEIKNDVEVREVKQSFIDEILLERYQCKRPSRHGQEMIDRLFGQ